MKRNIKDALKSSIEREEKSVIDRFERAESIMNVPSETIVNKDQSSQAVKQDTKSNSETEKLRRDTFTIPENEYTHFRELKLRCMKAGVDVAKSELVRAGIKMLSAASDKELLKAIEDLERFKSGRRPFKQ
jgi:hypothetical protein